MLGSQPACCHADSHAAACAPPAARLRPDPCLAPTRPRPPPLQGIETVGGVMTKLINRNTVIPTKKSQVGGPGRACQRVGPGLLCTGQQAACSCGAFRRAALPPLPRPRPGAGGRRLPPVPAPDARRSRAALCASSHSAACTPQVFTTYQDQQTTVSIQVRGWASGAVLRAGGWPAALARSRARSGSHKPPCLMAGSALSMY